MSLDIPLVFKCKRRNRACFSEISSILSKRMAHILRRSISVIGEGFYHNCDSSRGIALIDNLCNFGTILISTRSFLDRTLNIVSGDISFTSLFYSIMKGRVHCRVTTCTRSDGDKFCMNGKYFTASIIGKCFFWSNNWSSSHNKKW